MTAEPSASTDTIKETPANLKGGKDEKDAREFVRCEYCDSGYCEFEYGVWTGACVSFMITPEESNASNPDFVDLSGVCTCIDQCSPKQATPGYCYVGGRGSCMVSPRCISKNLRPWVSYWGTDYYLCC